MGSKGKIAELVRTLQDGDAICADSEGQLADRIKGFLPSWPEDIDGSRIFLEYKRTDAISFDKGRYTGQEVIEKMYSHPVGEDLF